MSEFPISRAHARRLIPDASHAWNFYRFPLANPTRYVDFVVARAVAKKPGDLSERYVLHDLTRADAQAVKHLLDAGMHWMGFEELELARMREHIPDDWFVVYSREKTTSPQLRVLVGASLARAHASEAARTWLCARRAVVEDPEMVVRPHVVVFHGIGVDKHPAPTHGLPTAWREVAAALGCEFLGIGSPGNPCYYLTRKHLVNVMRAEDVNLERMTRYGITRALGGPPSAGDVAQLRAVLKELKIVRRGVELIAGANVGLYMIQPPVNAER